MKALRIKKVSFTVLIAAFPTLLLCSCAETEHTEAITAEITAAQMEARRTAGAILGPEWKDSLKLQKALIDAKVKQSKYLIDGKPECAEAFDSTFISTIRTVNPDLAKKLRKN
ncbi:MAG: hypothetical protein J1F38_06510 [Muribaculaceae bacterium]|nr:hypothetical protein [Muribaculaceae bacterium]